MTAPIFLLLTLLPLQIRANAGREVPPTGCIAGVVTDALTSAPVPRAEVSVLFQNEETRVTTGGDGRFRFETLKAAKYQLYATAPGYIREGYNQHGSFFTGIVVGTGLDSEHLVFRLHPQAVIHGRISDERGDPIRNAAVQLFVRGDSRVGNRGFVQAQVQTDDLGEYRFAHLAAGKYRIAVQARPWYAQFGLNFQPQRPDRLRLEPRPAKPDSLLDVVYPVTFYPGVTDAHAAADLKVTTGSIEEANIQLRAVPSIHVRLTNLPLDENGVNIDATQLSLANVRASIPVTVGQISPGEYEVAGLPPGVATFHIHRNGSQEQVPSTITANVSGNETVDATAASANLSGRVNLPQPRADLEQAQFGLLGEGNQTWSALIHKDGTFSLAGVQTGTYKIFVNFSFGGQFMQSISASGAKIAGREIIIDHSGDVQLTITMGGVAQVTGVAMLEDKAIDGIMVLAVPASGVNLEDDSRIDQSDSDGTFTLANMIPGKYLLVAIRDAWDLEWRDPQALRPYLEKAQTLLLTPGEAKSVTVQVQPARKPR